MDRLGQGRGMPLTMYQKQQLQNQYAFQDDYGEDDDMGDYGMDYYEEDSDDPEGMDPAMANYPPGALFSGGQANKMAAQYGLPPGRVGMGAGAGAQLYGQQARVPFQGGVGGMGMGLSQPTQSTGGGFTYGMASKGGNLFGPPQASASQPTTFGAPSNQNPGLFQFGSVSQFGGMGGAGAFSAGGAGSLFGAGSQATASVPSSDPYANIAIDLNKIKKQEPPAKLHELKTAEEKKKEALEKEKKAAAGGKSNLKKDSEEIKEKVVDNKDKGKVTWGKSTTYEVVRGEDEDEGEYHNKDVSGRGSPRPSEKKVIAEKDLSDGRSEKEKIKEMLEKKEKEQLDEIKEIEKLKSQVQKKSGASETEESIGESSSMSNANLNFVAKKQPADSNSYESDDFEEASVITSPAKSKITHWPGKEKFGEKQKLADSVSQSQSQSQGGDEYDANAMEAYLNKQKQQQQQFQLTKQPNKQEVSESSDKYDEDFESVSKSQSGIPQVPTKTQTSKSAGAEQQKAPFDYKAQAASKTIISQYIKKENVGVQTDQGKYSYQDPSSQTSGSYKEWSLQQNLKDAETLIQELKASNAEWKQKTQDIESQMKKKDVEFQTMRREALNGSETNKRLQEQLKDSIHKNNLYKIEIEELIKQIDLADAKTREKEDEVKLVHAEYERKMKLQEERILFRRSKADEREALDLKLEHQVEKEELQQKIEQQKEQLDYYMQKVTKVESDNRSLRLGKDQNKRIKELEDEVELLQHQLSTSNKTQQENINLKNISKELSREDQIKLQKEMHSLEILLKGSLEENEKAFQKNKQLERDLKMTSEKLVSESKKVKDLQQKALLEKDKVYVEEAKDELDIGTVNNMGIGNAISQKQLQEMHAQLQKLQNDKQDQDRDWSIKEQQLKGQIQKVRDEKAIVEKNLYDTEFILGDKDREIQKLRDDMRSQKEQLEGKIGELEDKVDWFRSNQKLLAEDDELKRNADKDFTNMKEKVKKLEEESRRCKDLEKKCKQLEETIKSKNPNSIGLLIQATKENPQKEEEVRQLKERVKALEFQLDDKDKEFEKKVRTLRQEQERVKQLYEKKNGVSPEAKRIAELEEEVQNTKNYYNKRIKELEDKYKFRVPDKDSGKPPKSQALAPSSQELKQLEETIEKLTKENKFLAQKVVNLETQNNKRRQSFSGITQSIAVEANDDEKKLALSAIYSISCLMKLLKGDQEKATAFTLIEAALTCVEQLKGKDNLKNNLLSKHLLSLTQELNVSEKLNSQILDQIIAVCKPEIVAPQIISQPSFLNNLNQDLNPVLGQQELHEASPSLKRKQSSSKQVHPFVTQQQSAARPAKDILKLIVQSGIDFEKAISDNKHKPRMSIPQAFTILKQGVPSITIEEIKSISALLQEKLKGENDIEIVSSDKEDQIIDIQELANLAMDISLDAFGGEKIEPLARYSQQDNKQLFGLRTSEDAQQVKEEIKQLKDENRRKETEYKGQISKLQTLITDLNYDKKQMQDKIEKLDSQKERIEKILKQQLGGRKKGQQDDGSDILDEFAIMMKRIEFLEQQSEERSKVQTLGHESCKKEIQRLQNELTDEKNDKMRLLNKKNSEVAYFKSELDSLLNEMKTTMTVKKRIAAK